MSKYKQDIELIKDLESELERFNKKFHAYKSRIATLILEDGIEYSIKERASLKRAAMDLKQELHKVNKLTS